MVMVSPMEEVVTKTHIKLIICLRYPLVVSFFLLFASEMHCLAFGEAFHMLNATLSDWLHMMPYNWLQRIVTVAYSQTISLLVYNIEYFAIIILCFVLS